ncbi:XRE family transcriptional regulator [Bacillus sp. FJAT-29790]|uniref:helix-turn-helix domain-containing protein n=1 Tax=Bacillus sp. FJAT-29790 TaxID=1895002 RepID=UPI001C239F23|nr:XRE family transcriptional regulator [Bacillus sp. FJAT-29790]MBU8878805.1 XRE family transcriptional regulator [Bacillus sp. FJAT-29790]
MEKIQGIISNNLRRIRNKRKLSLDDLSTITGVSKSLLRQIEKEESNPTITTIWKIADGLKIPFSSLMKYEFPDTEIVRKQNIDALIEDKGLYRLYPYFNFEEQKPFEMYSVEMEPSARLKANPHNSGAIECITVFSGTLCLTINETENILHTGDSIKFKADTPHSYSNPSSKLTILSMVIYYPES